MDFYPVAIEKLIEEFAKLPSIGKKTAHIVLYVETLLKRILVQYVAIQVEIRA